MNRPARRPTHGYTVGVTIHVGEGGDLGLYENGLRQNVVFLRELFAASPNCARALFVNCGAPFNEWPPGIGLDGVPLHTPADIIDELDYVIVIGASLEPDLLRRARARGAKTIHYKGGNSAVISVEAILSRPPRVDAERYFDAGLFDELWMTPQHIRTYKGWAETVYRAPVRTVPQIWAPTFVDNRREALGGRFGYQPGKPAWRVSIMEPNITVMKTSHVPMLVTEAAYRAQPAMFAAIYVTNATPHAQNPHFVSFANSLSAAKNGIMTFEPRYVSADFLANHSDAVVIHQWENGLNYLYYEVLHGGYPLIHNSDALAHVGYHYPGFEADTGGEVLLDAFRRHDKELPAYRARAAELIAALAPTNPANISLHERLLIG